MASPLDQRTDPLYQKDGHLYTHTSPITSIHPLSSLPPDHQALFKPPPDSEPFILTTPSTIFHAQGGGQPSDTGTITPSNPNGPTFHVHQVRKIAPAILHMGTFEPPGSTFSTNESGVQNIDVEKRTLHSRIHTAGHVIGVAVNMLMHTSSTPPILPPDLVDGKASHYPGAAFVEFSGLIPGSAKDAIQAQVDELVARDLPVKILFWTPQRAREECTGSILQDDDVVVKGDEVEGVRVVEFGDVGRYPCGGTHVASLKKCGKVVVRGIKRQKGVSKVSYEVRDE